MGKHILGDTTMDLFNTRYFNYLQLSCYLALVDSGESRISRHVGSNPSNVDDDVTERSVSCICGSRAHV